jgi:hypothetical protein
MSVDADENIEGNAVRSTIYIPFRLKTSTEESPHRIVDVDGQWREKCSRMERIIHSPAMSDLRMMWRRLCVRSDEGCWCSGDAEWSRRDSYGRAPRRNNKPSHTWFSRRVRIIGLSLQTDFDIF